jgi:hypothetical protein
MAHLAFVTSVDMLADFSHFLAGGSSGLSKHELMLIIYDHINTILIPNI